MKIPTRGDLTSKVFRSFFDKWNQDKAHECISHVVLVDYVFNLLD